MTDSLRPYNQLQIDTNKSLFEGYVVAIGASAGGLNALESFFSNMPANTGAVFVVIQHLSPDHVSMMDKLLARHTQMPVLMASNKKAIQPNHVYLIPPGKTLKIVGQHLIVKPKIKQGLSLPIDDFFVSLATATQGRAVAVVLSGTGSDGTRGAVAIKDANGLLLAQEPSSAAFDGMPNSVIATGLVDLILNPADLAQKIAQYVGKQPLPPNLDLESDLIPTGQQGLEAILNLLYQESRINFKEYKPITVHRRIARRMQLKHCEQIEDYLSLLEADKEELMALKRDALIPVTRFFRDQEVFRWIEEKVIPVIFEKAQDTQQTVRIWIAACATGEEAYSYSILLSEAREKYRQWPQVKIFATDVEQNYIDFASAGVYPEAIAKEISPERLARFFTHMGNRYVVNSEIRQNIIFAKHNILEDPPFTKMHLVSCRNCLIYFDTHAQEKALTRFQYALNKDGFFVQGSSESLGVVSDDYFPESAKNKIFKLVREASSALTLPNTLTPASGRLTTRRLVEERNLSVEDLLIEQSRSVLLDAYIPPTLLVNQQRRLLHVFGDVSPYMQIRSGGASLDVTKLLLNNLSPVVIALLHKVSVENKEIYSDVHFKSEKPAGHDFLRIAVRPIINKAVSEKNYLISFEPVFGVNQALDSEALLDVQSAFKERIIALERDLSTTRDSLQAAIEELETSNEELQATNEELMATNEEMQSTNEELQSVNEELYTVNSENQEKIEILNRLNVDMDNMTRASMIPAIYLDHQLQIRRFSHRTGNLFKVRESDVGRPIDDFGHEMEYPELMTDLYSVLNDIHPIEREVRTKNNQWYLVRILPYFDQTKKMDGLVITFLDITHVKDSHKTQAILDTINANVALIDSEGVIKITNDAWKKFAIDNGDGDLSKTGAGQNYLQACRSDFDENPKAQDNVYNGILSVLRGQANEFSVTYPCHSVDEKKWYVLHVAPIKHPEGGAVITHFNITKWYQDGDNEK